MSITCKRRHKSDPQECCACHDICTWRLTKRCAPRNLHMEGHKVLCLPRNLHMEDHKVLCLPRNLHMEVHKVQRLTKHCPPASSREDALVRDQASVREPQLKPPPCTSRKKIHLNPQHLHLHSFPLASPSPRPICSTPTWIKILEMGLEPTVSSLGGRHLIH